MVYQWRKENELFAQLWDDTNEDTIDHVEGKLMELINGIMVEGSGENGSPIVYKVPPCKTSIIFFLKTRAKQRGYTERTEVEQINQIQVTVQTVETVGNDPGE